MRKIDLARTAPVAVALLAFVQPAAAVVTIVANSYVERLSDSCNAGPECTLRLSAVPSAKTLAVRHVSCNWTVAGSGVMTRISFRATSASGTVLAFLDHPLTASEQQAKSANFPVYSEFYGMALAAGTVPRVVFTADLRGAQSFSCTMAGDIS